MEWQGWERELQRDAVTEDMVYKAARWNSCAIGERYELKIDRFTVPDYLPRAAAQAALDMGTEFMYAIQQGRLKDARAIFADISALPLEAAEVEELVGA